MALLETYVSNLKNTPKENRVFVMRHRGHDNLAPPEELFKDFKAKEQELKKQGLDPIDAHNQAYEDVNFEERFNKNFLSNKNAIEELKEIKKLSEKEDVYLVCFEKPPKKCHRLLLQKLADEI